MRAIALVGLLGLWTRAAADQAIRDLRNKAETVTDVRVISLLTKITD